MKTTHSLKTWPQHFEAVRMGRKRAELRRNDRNFQPGDGLLLREWEPVTGQYTGRQLPATVTHLVRGGIFGLAEDYVLLSIRLEISTAPRLRTETHGTTRHPAPDLPHRWEGPGHNGQPITPAAAPALFDEFDTFRHRPDTTREQPPF